MPNADSSKTKPWTVSIHSCRIMLQAGSWEADAALAKTVLTPKPDSCNWGLVEIIENRRYGSKPFFTLIITGPFSAEDHDTNDGREKFYAGVQHHECSTRYPTARAAVQGALIYFGYTSAKQRNAIIEDCYDLADYAWAIRHIQFSHGRIRMTAFASLEDSEYADEEDEPESEDDEESSLFSCRQDATPECPTGPHSCRVLVANRDWLKDQFTMQEDYDVYTESGVNTEIKRFRWGLAEISEEGEKPNTTYSLIITGPLDVSGWGPSEGRAELFEGLNLYEFYADFKSIVEAEHALLEFFGYYNQKKRDAIIKAKTVKKGYYAACESVADSKGKIIMAEFPTLGKRMYE